MRALIHRSPVQRFSLWWISIGGLRCAYPPYGYSASAVVGWMRRLARCFGAARVYVRRYPPNAYWWIALCLSTTDIMLYVGGMRRALRFPLFLHGGWCAPLSTRCRCNGSLFAIGGLRCAYPPYGYHIGKKNGGPPFGDPPSFRTPFSAVSVYDYSAGCCVPGKVQTRSGLSEI